MGLIVGLSGIDGSGKTTVARLVVDRLQKQGLKVTYHHEFDFIVLKSIFKLVTKLAGRKRAEDAKRHAFRNMERSKPLYAGIYYFLIWLDNLISYLYFKLKRGIIVHDRWPYDIPAIFDYRHYKNRFIEKLLLGFPRPNILILLTVPPEIAHLRKKDDPSDWHQSIEFYRIIGFRMSEIAQKLKYDTIIDSNRPIDEVVDDVVTMIAKSTSSRYIVSKGSAMPKTPPSELYTKEYFLGYMGGAKEFLEHKTAARILKALSLLNPKPNEYILDVGCGRGEMIKECSNTGCKAIGIDYSAASVEIARNCGPVIRASATQFPFTDAAFDKIIFLGVIEHLDRTDSQRALKEIHRVLKRGGAMVLNTESYHPVIAALFRFYRSLESLFGIPGYGSLHVDEKSYRVLKSLLVQIGFTVIIQLERFSIPKKLIPPLAARRHWFRDLAWGLFCTFSHFFPKLSSKCWCIATKE